MKPETNQKLIAIGLDGGTFTILKPFIKRGLLPNLAKLLENGSHGNLLSTIPPLTSPAWISFASGKNPGKHGCLLFTQADITPGQGPSFTTAASIDSQTLWEVLSEQGKRVILVNIPMTYPPHPVNGAMITGMMTPSTASTFTYPPDLPARYPSLKNYIIDVGFIDQAMDMGTNTMFATSPGEFIARIDQMREARTDACLALLAGEPWDFFMVVYTGVDRISHFFWHELAALAEGEDPKSVAHSKQLLAYFGKLDEDIGRLTAAGGEGAYTLLMSDHGFGPRATKALYLNNWLHDQGLLVKRKRGEERADSGVWLMRLKSALGDRQWFRSLASKLPMGFRVRLRKQSITSQGALVDWENAKAYTIMMASFVAGIKINNQLPEGIREEITRQLIDTLPGIQDPKTGRPLIKRVFRREEIYKGHHVPSFPEIILIADEDYEVVNTMIDHGYSKPMLLSIRNGDHRPEGIFALSGSGVRQTELQEDWYLPDVTATILYALGCALPDDLDGRPIAEAFMKSFLDEHPENLTPAIPPNRMAATPSFSDAENDALLERLRGLGYIE